MVMITGDARGFEVRFGERWIDLMGKSDVTIVDETKVLLEPNGDRGVRCRVEIEGAEWIAKFSTYLAELKRQQKFNEEKCDILKTNARETLLGLLVSENTRDRYEWWGSSKITLSYDEVTEEFEPTDEDIISAIRQVGEDKNNRILNLSGCQSQACMSALIEIPAILILNNAGRKRRITAHNIYV